MPNPDQQRGQARGHDVASHALTHDIQAITHYLRNESPLLDLVAIEIYQHLIGWYGAELDQEMTSDTILTTLKNWARAQCDRHNHWVESAKGISTSLVAKAIQSMERDLGHTMLESLDWNEFNQILFQYLFEHPATPIQQRLKPLEQHYAQMLTQQIISDLDLDHQPIASLKRSLGLIPSHHHTLPLLGQTLSHVGPIPEVASEMPLMVGENWDGDLLFSDQFQADLWASDAREVAYLRYHSKQRRHQYLEHYLTTDADIDSLAWDGIAQILTKFGLTAAKLHMLLLAYSAQQTHWQQPFTVTIDQLVTDIGWQLLPTHSTESGQAKRHNVRRLGINQTGSPTPIPQTKVTNVLYALSCTLVKLVWVEHSSDRAVKGQTPVGQLWDIVLVPSGEFDWQTGQIDVAEQISAIVRPGLWLEGLRHSSYSMPKAADAFALSSTSPPPTELDAETGLVAPSYYRHVQQKLGQCGALAHQLLHLGAYAQDLAIRIIVHLMLDIQIQTNEARTQQYSVQALLEQVIPPPQLARARTHIKQGQQLFEAWNDVLTVLVELQWYPEANHVTAAHSGDCPSANPKISTWDKVRDTNLTQFYVYPYPKWLTPHSTMRKPRGWVQTWMEQTVQIRSDIQTMAYI
ncbi:MAG: hypothetical protein F6K30_03525 [Cyanothece sp. SIO2G6]|nr:hypothetical protein [Cyanothece sp. SIO2G6]